MYSGNDNNSKKDAKDSSNLANQENVKQQSAATIIQKTFRGYLSRKKTNIFGRSQGKEIEVYLPFGVRNKTTKTVSCEDMIGGYKYLLCTSDLFNIQLDCMNFLDQTNYKAYQKKQFLIPEIVTAPCRQLNEVNTNLPTEEKIDNAVSDFLQLLKDFAKQASELDQPSILLLDDLLNKYNQKHSKHPLHLVPKVKNYLKNPQCQGLLTQTLVPVKKHQNTELCLVYDARKYPQFDTYSTPKTPDAKKIADQTGYQSGELIVHIQKTFSLAIADYKPESISKDFNVTEYQMELLRTAQARAEQLIKEFPLPVKANKEKVLGLLTVCVEHILCVTNAKQYKGLHEKADRPILSIRHILHYIKLNVCNKSELDWFDNMFNKHLPDIQRIFGKYYPDFRGKGEFFGSSEFVTARERYDVIFDLFGDFSNRKSYTTADADNPYLKRNACEYGIKSWKHLFHNHESLSGRAHLVLQRQFKELKEENQPLFEARRIGMMTIDEFIKGKSRISLLSVGEKQSVPVTSASSAGTETALTSGEASAACFFV